jgi:putative intracellular protease/amidase
VDEVPELAHTSFVREEGRYTGAVCRGDLALAKMPLKKAQNRQAYFENQSREMVDAVNAQLMGQNDSRMPIRNNSKTQITKGRAAKFQD